jgi:nicotinate phosphoribosyltransferase
VHTTTTEKLDPVIRSLLDTDFYKLLMLQFIWKRYSKIRVSFLLFNCTSSVRLADMFATKEVVEQLEHVRSCGFESELVWLAGNTFYGHRGIFERAFLEWLEQDFKLSDYVLSVMDGQFHLSFEGTWPETTMWELYAVDIFDELRTRASMKKLSEFYLDILYARAKTSS